MWERKELENEFLKYRVVFFVILIELYDLADGF